MAGCGPVDLSSNLSPHSQFSLEKKSGKERKTTFQVVQLLSQNALTQKQIIKQLKLTDRAIRYALSNLLKRGIILQRASLLDARQKYYEVIK